MFLRFAIAACLTALISLFAFSAPHAEFNGCQAGFCTKVPVSAAPSGVTLQDTGTLQTASGVSSINYSFSLTAGLTKGAIVVFPSAPNSGAAPFNAPTWKGSGTFTQIKTFNVLGGCTEDAWALLNPGSFGTGSGTIAVSLITGTDALNVSAISLSNVNTTFATAFPSANIQTVTGNNATAQSVTVSSASNHMVLATTCGYDSYSAGVNELDYNHNVLVLGGLFETATSAWAPGAASATMTVTPKAGGSYGNGWGIVGFDVSN